MSIGQAVIGVATLGFEWQNLTSQTRGELFRIGQVWGEKQPGNYCLIAQYFPELGCYYGIKRIYPGSDQVIISMPVPDLLLTEGLDNRYLAVKMSNYYRWATVEPWTITVTELYANP